MGIDRFGQGLRTPAPESTASLCAPGPAPLAPYAVALVGLSQKKAPAQVVRSRQTYERGDQIGLESINGSTKAVNTPVRVNYRSQNTSFNGGEWETMNYPVSLDWTDCGFGGQRVWWRCPAVGCGRRVAVLYGGRVFACRECHRLAYRSQREAFDDRATRRADKLRDRLGWEPGILNGTGWKPKGMHWRTFERLHRKHDANVETALAGMAAKLGILTGQLKDFDF